MGRSVDADDLVGTAEIADRLQLASPELVHSWRRRGVGFPEPVVRLRIGYVWSWRDVEAWAKKTGRLP